MLNEAARKLVSRAARVAAQESRDRLRLGANIDDVAADAWETATVSNPDFREWEGAQRYFEAVFQGESCVINRPGRRRDRPRGDDRC